VDEQNREFARGLAAYASSDVTRIKGVSTRRIAQLLGYSNGDEVIHRDDLVLLGSDVSRRAESGASHPRVGGVETK
jgi:glutamate 5-kinase